MFVVYLSTAMVGFSQLQDGPWPMFHHDIEHTGQSPYSARENGILDWTYSLDGDASSPVVGSDGTIYVGSWNDKLYAINPDGTCKWSKEMYGSVETAPALDSSGVIYVGDRDGVVYAIYPNGTVKWSNYYVVEAYTSPTIGTDGTIYIGADFTNEIPYLLAGETPAHLLAEEAVWR
jgi:outer membrane protein assembly factor BamB